MSALLAEWSVAVEAWKVADFARAVGDDHPTAPAPTFPVVLTAAFIERLVRELLPVDRRPHFHMLERIGNNSVNAEFFSQQLINAFD